MAGPAWSSMFTPHIFNTFTQVGLSWADHDMPQPLINIFDKNVLLIKMIYTMGFAFGTHSTDRFWFVYVVD